MIACPFITEGHPFEPAMARIRGALAGTVSPPPDARRRVRQNELNLREAWLRQGRPANGPV